MPQQKNSQRNNRSGENGDKIRGARRLFPLGWMMVCAGLAGCTVGPNYQPPQENMPQGFLAKLFSPPNPKPSAAKNTAPVDIAAWWKSLGDPELDALVDRAIKGNTRIEIALDRMQEARSQEAVVLGAALPAAEASGGGGLGTGSDLARGRASGPLVSSESTGKSEQVTQIGGFDAGWELDLFGKYRREMEASKYDTEAAIAARNDVLVSVIADVARAYVDMRALQMQLAVLEKNAATLKNYLRLTKERFNRGITNELDLTLAQREYHSLESERAPLKAQIHAAQYVIAVLIGQFPENLAKELEKPGLIPPLPENIEAGLPLDLLRRRPDIREAERQAAAATARIGVAEADLFPRVSLTGAAGYQAQGNSAITNISTFIWSAGPSISWSLLDFGTLDAQVEVAGLRAKEMLARYRQTVLNAVEEVDTSLGTYTAEQEKLRDLDKALAASQRAVSLANERYDRGLTDALNVIDAERQEYTLEQQYVSSQQAAAGQFVALYRAVGGGWENYQSFPPVHRPQPAVIAAFTRLLKQ